MFPSSLEHPFQQSRGRRRGRNQPNNRDYICPCGKSYLSYPALFTHIKIKHNGRAPGQVIKPRSQNSSRRGRPRQKEIYDSQSDTQDIASNCIDRLCDFITEIEKPEEGNNLKEMYMKNDFYEIYRNFNPQEQEPKYDEGQELYEETCSNVFCQMLAEISKRLNEPYYFDVMFSFFIMLTKYINEEYHEQEEIEEKRSNQPFREESGNIIEEQEEQEEEEEIDSQERGKIMKVETTYIRNIVVLINNFFMNFMEKYKQEFNLTRLSIFKTQNVARLVELFYNWLTSRKYLCYKLKINKNFNFEK